MKRLEEISYQLIMHIKENNTQKAYEAIDSLKDKVNQVDKFTPKDRPLLKEAVHKGNHAVVKYLIENNVDVNHITNENYSALTESIHHEGRETSDHMLILKTLLNNSTIDVQKHALDYAILHGKTESIKIIQKHMIEMSNKYFEIFSSKL